MPAWQRHSHSPALAGLPLLPAGCTERLPRISGSTDALCTQTTRHFAGQVTLVIDNSHPRSPLRSRCANLACRRFSAAGARGLAALLPVRALLPAAASACRIRCLGAVLRLRRCSHCYSGCCALGARGTGSLDGTLLQGFVVGQRRVRLRVLLWGGCCQRLDGMQHSFLRHQKVAHSFSHQDRTIPLRRCNI